MRSPLFALALSSVCAASVPCDAAPTNVLFCIADDASPHFGAYGCTWVKTPHIDRLAAAGLVFENAYTPTAKCAPSRAALLTGRNPWQLEDAANHQSIFPPKFKAFTEALAEAGVYVGSQGKTWGPGTAKNADGSNRTWGFATSGGDSTKPDETKFRAFLAARPAGKPFFFWFGSTNPHRTYVPDSGLSAGKKPGDIEHVPAFWPDNDVVRRDMLDYAVEVETFDAQVGALLKVLDETGEADRTLVIVTSDHGMPFPRVKGHNYEMSNHVPLVARWPAGIVGPGRRAAEFVSFIDLAPTLLDVFGVSPQAAGLQPITGASLRDLFEGKPARDRSVVLLGRERNDVRARPGTEAGLGYPVRGIREGNLLYLHNFAPDRWPCGNVELGLLDTDDGPTKQYVEDAGDGDRCWQFCFGKRPAEELFDLATDADCVRNLAADPARRGDVERLHAKLVERLQAQEDPRILGRGDVFDHYPTSKPAVPPKRKKQPAT